LLGFIDANKKGAPRRHEGHEEKDKAARRPLDEFGNRRSIERLTTKDTEDSKAPAAPPGLTFKHIRGRFPG
jgi:hypothetical protein